MWSCIENSLQRPEDSWSLGSFGAIAEFSWAADEEIQSFDDGRTGQISERGGIACYPLQNVRPVAYETLRKDSETWGQAVAFCLPEKEAVRAGRGIISELGRDKAALLPQHRDHILFDLGLGIRFADFCVRSDNGILIEQLRAACGSVLLAAGNPIMPLLLQASPHRVFETNLARIEVYQPIGIEKSPEGPHTHVLPKLIAQGRAFSANTPINTGLLPLLTLHPANPCRDTLGKRKSFDANAYAQFQMLMERWGIEEYQQQKNTTFAALTRNSEPTEFDSGHARLARLATRIAIRQYAHLHSDHDVLAWRQAFDMTHHKRHEGNPR